VLKLLSPQRLPVPPPARNFGDLTREILQQLGWIVKAAKTKGLIFV
jgi:hypothetical protein